MKTTKQKHIERGGTAETFAARQKAIRDGNAAALAVRQAKAREPTEMLRQALLDAFDNTVGDMTEREALEVADSVAEGWRMRLSELDDE